MDATELTEKLASIEKRLTRIENKILITPAYAPKPQPAAVPQTPLYQSHQPAISERSEPYYNAKPGNWLGIAAIICFVLAAGFIIKLSIDSGWLTPARQCGLAALLGFALIGAGFALRNLDRAYASLLPGGGIIVLYVTVFAAHSYYALIGFEIAIAATSLLSLLCIWLYTRIGHDAYAITAAFGAYISPSILGLNHTETFSLYYFLLCSLAFATISIWVESRLLTIISAYLAIFATACAGADLHNDALVASMLALHFLIFTTGTYLYSTQTGKALTKDEAISFLPVLLIFYATEYYFIARIHPDIAPWISLGFAAVLIGFYLAAKTYFPEKSMNSQFLISSFATLVCFHSVYIELLPAHARPWLLVAFMFAAAFLPGNVGSGKWRDEFPIPALAVFAIVCIEYIDILGHLIGSDGADWMAVSFAAFVSIWCVLINGRQASVASGLLGAAHILAICGLYRLTHDSGSLAVSVAWLVYAICVISFAFTRKDEAMAKSALIVLSLAAGKALLYDAASAPTVVRILCLLLTGAALYGSGLLMRRISGWKS